MPKSTFAFGFEWKVLELAARLAERHGARDESSDPHKPWLFVADDEGALQVVPLGADWREKKERALASGLPSLFFHPFDAPEYTWLEWSHVDRQTMEALMDKSFQEGDFVSTRTKELQPFPESWGVMF
jgi:hypothetical protein